MIEWRFETSRRRMVKRFGYINNELAYSILATKIGGPWVLNRINDSGIDALEVFGNVGEAKRFAESIEGGN